MAVSLRQLSGEQRKCMEGRPRLPPRLMTPSRHAARPFESFKYLVGAGEHERWHEVTEGVAATPNPAPALSTERDPESGSCALLVEFRGAIAVTPPVRGAFAARRCRKVLSPR